MVSETLDLVTILSPLTSITPSRHPCPLFLVLWFFCCFSPSARCPLFISRHMSLPCSALLRN